MARRRPHLFWIEKEDTNLAVCQHRPYAAEIAYIQGAKFDMRCFWTNQINELVTIFFRSLINVINCLSRLEHQGSTVAAAAAGWPLTAFWCVCWSSFSLVVLYRVLANTTEESQNISSDVWEAIEGNWTPDGCAKPKTCCSQYQHLCASGFRVLGFLVFQYDCFWLRRRR